jgi:uncharacterized protein YkwD
MSRAIQLAILLLAPACTVAAERESLQLINDLRGNECARRALPPLRRVDKLERAASYVLLGSSLRDALLRAGYRADRSQLVHIARGSDPAALRPLLAKQCAAFIDPRLTEGGMSADEHELAIVLTKPFNPPGTADRERIAAEVLQLVNEARGSARRCGANKFAAVPPLGFARELELAARQHAEDMARRGYASHDGSDGSTPGVRAARARYKWRSVGENVAGGHLTAREVVDGWLASPGHCANIMDGDYRHMAVAFVVNRQSPDGVYWVQMFGRR